MRKFLPFSVFAICAALLLNGCDDKNVKKEVTESPKATTQEKIVVGLDDSFPPMGFRDDSNQLVGFDIDMAREVAKHANMDVEFKPIDWSAKEAELNSKRVDMLWNGLTITEYRKEKLLFSNPYMLNHQIIVVNADSDIATKSDLADKIVGIQEGSSALDAVDADPIKNSFKELKSYADNVIALLDLSNKRLDAVVVDEVVGRYYVSKKPDVYKVLNDNFGEEEYGIGFRKDAQALVQKVQSALDEMKKDGTSAKIANKWFGKDVTY